MRGVCVAKKRKGDGRKTEETEEIEKGRRERTKRTKLTKRKKGLLIEALLTVNQTYEKLTLVYPDRRAGGQCPIRFIAAKTYHMSEYRLHCVNLFIVYI